MISSAFFGGVGGVEKLLKSVIESMPDALFYIMAREVRCAGFLPETHNYLLNIRPSRKTPINLYFYFAGGGRPTYLGKQYAIKSSMIDTCGSNIRDIEGQFDWVAIQTGNAGKYSQAEEKWALAFPDMRRTFPKGRKPVALPPRYFVTVFNPYSDKLKGGDVVYRAADHAALPIVWCYSDQSGLKFPGMKDHSNVIHLKNLSQEELYYVYEHAYAYISFSHSEGLGWAIAEAFYSGLPIITREVGVVTYIKNQPGVFVYHDEEELFHRVQSLDVARPDYDTRYLDQHSFDKIFERIIETGSPFIPLSSGPAG